jgi:hypothetical protein
VGRKGVGMSAEWHHITGSEAPSDSVKRLSYMGILANQCSLEPQEKRPKPLKTWRSLGDRKCK